MPGDNTGATCNTICAMRSPYRRRRRSISLPDLGLSEVLFEFAKVGRHLRVNAIDPKTGTEITMVADPRYGETLIKRLAARKLAYVIRKQAERRSRDPESQSGWDM